MAIGNLNIAGGGVEAYPIGSIYMSFNSTEPSILFGGTQERIKDRFILAAGDSYTAGRRVAVTHMNIIGVCDITCIMADSWVKIIRFYVD